MGARPGRLRYAAALASGPTEVMDFLLPLWAAADIGATPAAIGLVVAIKAGASLAVRPVAGVLADRADRQLVAAIGAALYAAAFIVYAVAPGIVVVALGAAVGGTGGALFWVALRAGVGAQLEQDPAAYARLLSSEQAGSLAAFQIGHSLLASIGYRPLFLTGAAACGAAMALLLGGARYRQAGTSWWGRRANRAAPRRRKARAAAGRHRAYRWRGVGPCPGALAASAGSVRA